MDSAVKLDVESIQNKVLTIMNGRKNIEIEELKGKFEKIEIIYLLVNMFNFDRISFCNIDTKRFIDMGGYYSPYLQIYQIGVRANQNI